MGLRRFLLSWILLLQGAGAASAVSVVGGALGGSVHFSVSLPSEANGAVQWTSKGVLVALLSPGSAPQYYGQCVRRCHIYSNGSLTMDNIVYTDEGEYTMTAFNSDSAPVTSETFQLRVYAALTKPDLRIPSSPLVNGTNVTLYCDAGSQNVTTYTFYRGEKTVNCSEPHVTCRGAYLDFTPITESDSGSYTCSIQNPVSSSTSAPLSLTVSEPLNSTGLPNNTLSNVTEGGRVSLIVSLISGARARADSSTSQTLPAKFSWYRHPSLETIVTGGPFIVISSDYTSNLTINPVSMAQNGTYECRAENVMGSATFIFNVVVSPKVGSSTGLNGGEIVGIVIGVLAGVALIGVIAFFAVKKKDTKEVIYENADPPAVHIYDTKLPAAGVVTAMPMREESNYQQLTHPDKSVYHTVMPGPGR